MIVLSNTKEIINVESWEDITSRLGFSGSLDPHANKLDAIIGRYQFREKVPCGLSNCHTPHNKGYIVATKSGQETNIGKDCGKNYFGVDFETLSAKFDRDITERENREKVWNFMFMRAEALATQIRDLRGGDFGGDWVYRTSRPLFDGGRQVPSKVVRKVMEMVKTGDVVLTQEREANERELAEMDERAGRRGRRPQIISAPIAQVAGLDLFSHGNDIKNLLVYELAEQLRELEELDIDIMTFEQLRKWARWIGEVDGRLERAAAAIEKGRKLLTISNLTPFGIAVELNSEEMEQYQKYLKQLPA